MFHKARCVYPLSDHRLCVMFRDGTTKIYDMKRLMAEIPALGKLEGSEEFYGAYVDVGGYGIVWNDDADLSCEEIWYNGEAVKTPFDGLLTLSEAAKEWKLDESAIRDGIAEGRFAKGVDVCRFGDVTVVSAEAMEREYGKNPGTVVGEITETR